MDFDYSVTYDPTAWLYVPASADLSNPGEYAAWQEAVVEDYLERGVIGRRDRKDMRRYLEMLTNLADEHEDLGGLYVYVPPLQELLPVFVAVTVPLEPLPDYLLTVAGAYVDTAIDSPTVSYVNAKHLGEGVRVVRFEKNTQDEVYATVTYAWRVEDADVLVTIQSPEPAELVQFQDEVDTLLDGIELIHDQPSPTS